MANRFFQAGRHQYQSQFVPRQLPLDLMAKGLANKEAQYQTTQKAILDARALADAFAQTDDAETGLKHYQDERLPATAAIVLSNRKNGPEQCMQLAHERAPDGFDRIENVFATGELQEIADRYKQLTGMKKALAS